MLATATVFVFPSVYEQLGIVNFEAAACAATAVAASDVGGIPEAVADGITCSLLHDDPAGYQNRPADAVDFLIVDPERAERYGRAGGSAASGISPGTHRRTHAGDLQESV
jgi:starch synthase